ncbi:MAG: LysM peptidoglycan-binding domain-containing protein [Actinobacteria bacterium]|uniref:Unannotated protein n=1 Tax=freshwater metagenome TaxID=449393 RepID=A0A6J6NS50_9ZZZZ|nr:LysM peptidoglycan-binding domain-containing protein [Actinomycetota bacterium]MSY88283.1 LysM peptidoglycan-binding domain-containing protein [Actinomycetota bacterium]MTA49947.1 LysM peptidoglycan-binding domain-containing protein [Actinomycetota bacterium]
MSSYVVSYQMAPRLKHQGVNHRESVQAIQPMASAVPLRLTARGRLVVRLLVLASLLTLTLSVATFSHSLIAGALAEDGSTAGSSGAGNRAVSTLTYEEIIVLPGETLWSIARHVSTGADVRSVVDSIVELNHLDSAGLVAGQRLTLPITQ